MVCLDTSTIRLVGRNQTGTPAVRFSSPNQGTTAVEPSYVWKDRQLTYKNRISIHPRCAIPSELLEYYHQCKTAGHEGIGSSYHHSCASFYWPRMMQSLNICKELRRLPAEPQCYCSPCPFHKPYVKTSQWLLLKVFQFPMHISHSSGGRSPLQVRSFCTPDTSFHIGLLLSLSWLLR